MIEKIQKIIDKYDPINLYPGHMTPDDEYLSEAKIISERYRDVSDVDTFIVNMEKLFIDRFSESVIDLEKLKNMAREIYSFKENNKGCNKE